MVNFAAPLTTCTNASDDNRFVLTGSVHASSSGNTGNMYFQFLFQSFVVYDDLLVGKTHLRQDGDRAWDAHRSADHDLASIATHGSWPVS
jgi:hypothetical protein